MPMQPGPGCVMLQTQAVLRLPAFPKPQTCYGRECYHDAHILLLATTALLFALTLLQVIVGIPPAGKV